MESKEASQTGTGQEGALVLSDHGRGPSLASQMPVNSMTLFLDLFPPVGQNQVMPTPQYPGTPPGLANASLEGGAFPTQPNDSTGIRFSAADL